MMIFPSCIEKKLIFSLPFALATPLLRPHDPPGGPNPQVGKPCTSLVHSCQVFILSCKYVLIISLYRSYQALSNDEEDSGSADSESHTNT